MNYLWKRTLGTGVLNATASSQEIRAYAHSGAPPSPFAAAECVAASTQLLLLNLDDEHAIEVQLPSSSASAPSYAWVLAPPAEGPFATTALLNGVELPAVLDVSEGDPDFLREIPVAAQVANATLLLPPLSVAFVCESGFS